MRKLLLFSFLLSLSFTALAQNVTFERPYYSYSFRSLPQKPFDREVINTFSPSVKLDAGMKMSFDEFEICGRLRMPGFKKMEPVAVGKAAESDLVYFVAFNDIQMKERTVVQNKKEIKDKDGKVTGYDYSYYTKVTYGYNGNASLSDKDGEVIDQKSFGTDQDVWNSEEYPTREKAVNYYNDNSDLIKTQLRENAIKRCLEVFDGWMATNYTYPDVKRAAKFLIVNTKKHPEYAKFQEISKIIKQGCELVTANTTLDQAKEEFAPAIKSLNELLEKYSDTSDKKLRKIRYAILYDIARIASVLDDYETVDKYGKLIIENDFTAGEGKEFCTQANYAIERLVINKAADFHPMFKLAPYR